MDYSVLADVYEKLESVSSKLTKTDVLADLFRKTPSDKLEKVVLLSQGRVFPVYSEFELGIATQMMTRAISKATGLSMDEVEESFKKTGDLGSTAEKTIKSKKQVTLVRKRLTVDFVFDSLQKLATTTGKGSQDIKVNLISGLIVSATPKEARYIVRTILQDMRIGVAEGIVRDAIVGAFLARQGMPKEEKEKAADAVEHAWNIVTDFGEVARIAREKGVKGLERVEIRLGRPINVMLGEKVDTIEEVVKEFGKVAAEFKYDGMRTIIERKGKEVWIYTRRLENVTRQFPDLKELVLKGIKSDDFIVEGETLGIGPKTKLPLPFQTLSQRIHRKHGIDEMKREIPIQVNLFDVIYLNGRTLVGEAFSKRRETLKRIVSPVPGKLKLSEQIVSDNVKDLERFYKKALDEKQEGLMLKVLDAHYTFGRHVGTMYKIKPVMENLDLIIIGATWGEGARANWLTSYVLACRDPDSGKLLECGMISTGLTEEEYETMTKTLKPLITDEKGKTVKVRPKVIIEIGYQEIQKSPNYSSGYALRFPTFKRFREDKKEPDDITRMKKLYESQGRAG